MKKTLLALAITALSANAFAANVDYTVATPVVNTIATELNIPGTNVITTVDTLTWDVGFSITANTQRYIRVTLGGGATFSTAPTMAVDGVAAVLSQGGTPTTSYAIFEVSPAANVLATADVVLTLANLKITGKNSISAAYSLYETAVDAVNSTNALASKPAAPYVNFASGLSTKVQSLGTQKVINVSATPASSTFTGALTATTAKVAGVAIDAVAGLVTYNTAVAATLANLVAAGTQLVITGDFSAGVQAAGLPVVGTAKLGGVDATSMTATTATFLLNENAVGAPATPTYVDVVYTVGGTAAITPAVYTGLYDVVTDAVATTSDVNLGQTTELAKNGASEEVNLALNPNGVYSNFVRISNTSSIAGEVFLTVINDAGASKSIKLQDIAGQTATNVLGAGASTTQINIQSIFAAAEAKGLVLTGEKKLRLVVDAQVPSIDVQSITVAKDSNSFATFN